MSDNSISISPGPALYKWLEELLSERFGLDLSITRVGDSARIAVSNNEGYLAVPIDLCFYEQKRQLAFCWWDCSCENFKHAVSKMLPVPGRSEFDGPLCQSEGLNVSVNYDILGLTFWMLSRLEEVSATRLDNHQRFSADASHAYQHGYLERPVVDEWLFVLGQIITMRWPQAPIKEHAFGVWLSHDVDDPAKYAFKGLPALLKLMLIDIGYNHDVKAALVAPLVRATMKDAIPQRDPYNTFNWIMTQSEQLGLVSSFYFICGVTDVAKDADYNIDHPAIRELLRSIHRRGHEIGLHPSYQCYLDPDALAREANALKRVCEQECIAQDQWGGRMHYLRWRQPETMRAWEAANMGYDSTLGYADMPGFRCGTCFEYTGIDPITHTSLNLRIRPLIAMECTVLFKRYLGLSADAAQEKLIQLKDTCKKVNGRFSLLWHNSLLATDTHRRIYKTVVES